MSVALVVYSRASKIPRRLVIPDNDHEVILPEAHLGPGEWYVSVPVDEIHSRTPHEHVAAHHGVSAADIPTGRCAVLDATDRVVNIVWADPDIDALPGFRLIASDTLQIGDLASATA